MSVIMEHLRSWLFLAVVIFLCGTLFVSCGGDEAATGGRTIGGPEPEGERGAEHRLSVRILPESPTVTSELQASVSGGVGTMRFVWMRNGEPIIGASGDRLKQGSFKKGDEVSVVVISDGMRSTASVTIANSPPSVTQVVLEPKSVYRGVDIRARAMGEDPDGDVIRFDYQWIINGKDALTQRGAVLKGSVFKRGDRIGIRVVPYDGEQWGDPYTPLPVVIPNAPPRFVSTPPQNFKGHYTYQVKTEDPDGDMVSYSLSVAPEGMRIDGKGLIEWDIQEDDAGEHVVEVVADDGYGGNALQKFKISVEISRE